MAYFSNGSEGDCFDQQCARCKYNERACPIATIQLLYNYDQLNDTTGTARKIMDELVAQNGSCQIYEMAKQDFAINPNQLKMDFG